MKKPWKPVLRSLFGLWIAVGTLLLSSCTPKGKPEQPVTPESIKKPMMEQNKLLVDQESERIDGYIRRRKWDMQESGTGLRYMIYQAADTSRPLAREGQTAVVKFTVSLLDGTVCYSSKEKGPQPFLIGMDDVESGLHEGVQHMRVGDKARLILPSHLAHGLVGDRNKIPPRATVIYDLELIALR